MAYSKNRPLNRFVLTAMIADISTAGQIYIAAPCDGKILEAQSALNGVIDTADSILTLKINGTAVTGGTMTVAHTDSAAGDIDSCTPTALNRFKKGDAIEIETGGQSGQTISTVITLECLAY